MADIIIENEQQYTEAIDEIETYLEKGFANLTNEEDTRLGDLTNAVEIHQLASLVLNPSAESGS